MLTGTSLSSGSVTTVPSTSDKHLDKPIAPRTGDNWPLNHQAWEPIPRTRGGKPPQHYCTSETSGHSPHPRG